MMLQNLMMVFGFEMKDKFTKDEFYYFLDSFFAGAFCLLICQGHQMPHKRAARLHSHDIESLCDLVFPAKKQVLERKEFCEMF